MCSKHFKWQCPYDPESFEAFAAVPFRRAYTCQEENPKDSKKTILQKGGFLPALLAPIAVEVLTKIL